MTDLAAFLLARVAEREAVARAATRGPWMRSKMYGLNVVAPDRQIICRSTHPGMVTTAAAESANGSNSDHIAFNEPARILADCEAVRRVVELHEDAWGQNLHTELGRARQGGARLALRALAAPYAGHPDYREEWAL